MKLQPKRIPMSVAEGSHRVLLDVSGVSDASDRQRLQDRVRECGFEVELHNHFFEKLESSSLDQPSGHLIVVGDLSRIAEALGHARMAAWRSLSPRRALVAWVRSSHDREYAASVDDLIKYLGPQTLVCDYEELLEPACLKRVLTSTDARTVTYVSVAPDGDRGWIEFGDGLKSTFSWDDLGLGDVTPRLLPETATVGDDPFSVDVLNEDGEVFEIDSNAVRVLVDAELARETAGRAAGARNEVGERLRQKRQTMRFTQQQLAEASGLQQSLISKLEKGKHQPTFSTLEKYAHGLGLKVASLLD